MNEWLATNFGVEVVNAADRRTIWIPVNWNLTYKQSFQINNLTEVFYLTELTIKFEQWNSRQIIENRNWIHQNIIFNMPTEIILLLKI